MVDEVLLARSHLTSQISYKAQASLVLTQSVWSALMCSYSLPDECNGPLKEAHAHVDDDRYDMVECGAAGQIILDLSD